MSSVAGPSYQQYQHELTDESLASVRRREEKLREFEVKTRADKLTGVPTDILDVKRYLRFYNEPITLFGEGPAERRDRLKIVMARLDIDGRLVRPPSTFAGLKPSLVSPSDQDAYAADAGAAASEAGDQDEEQDEEEGEFFTEGTDALKQARLFIARYSLSRAAERVYWQRMLHTLSIKKAENLVAATVQEARDGTNGNADAMSDEPSIPKSNRHDENDGYDLKEDVNRKDTFIDNLKNFTGTSSQVSGDERPICCIAAHNGVVLSSSWSGLVKLWNLKDSTCIKQYRAHEERATSCAFHPSADTSVVLAANNADSMQDSEDAATYGTVAFASGSADNTAKLWSFESTKPLHVLSGHTDRLTKMAFHPSGRFLGTASFDGTWRLWDLSVGCECLVEYEGHSSYVYSVVFYCDGALAASCDLGGIIRVWDLRTGRTVLPFKGHSRKILGLDWSPNGFYLASGSDDNTVRIWDLRKQSCMHVIPAHNKLVSHIKYEPIYGRYLVSCSYDNTMKIWSTTEHRLIKTLRGHENLVFCADIHKPTDASSITPAKQYSLQVDDFAKNDTIVSCSFDKRWNTYTFDEFGEL